MPGLAKRYGVPPNQIYTWKREFLANAERAFELLRVSRSGLYYEPVPTSPEELALMRRIDELHLKYPPYGSRKLGPEHPRR